MGLDMYLERFSKLNTDQTYFESDEGLSTFTKCPRAFEGLEEFVRKVKVKTKEYDMPAIARDYANAESCRVGMIGGGKVGFRAYNEGNDYVYFEVDYTDLEKYILEVDEDQWLYNAEEIGYWRKANQIREWIVNRFDCEGRFEDNGYTILAPEELQVLRDACMTILEAKEEGMATPTFCSKILPSSDGFFFGSTDYDEWYFEQLEDTVKIIDNALETTDWENEIVAYYEWY